VKFLISRLFLGSLLAFSIALNFFILSKLKNTHIRHQSGSDCSIEMKNFVNGNWDEVILIHGYMDNHSVATHLVEIAEKEEAAKGESSREKGSFRVKVH
jgi:hypothetical protein